MSALLEVRNLQKNFGGLRAVGGLSFEVQRGEVLGLLGRTARARPRR
jgi:branched-chain amino acid transport system ATP-binding protein